MGGSNLQGAHISGLSNPDRRAEILRAKAENALAARVVTAEAAIVTNAADIATNVTNIATNTADIAELQTVGYVTRRPTTNIDATTTGTFTDWVEIGDVTVPDWASTALVQINILGVYDVTAANNLYTTRATLGGNAETTSRNVRGLGLNARFGFSWMATFTALPSAGARAITIQMLRSSGTGALRCPANAATFDAVVTWLP